MSHAAFPSTIREINALPVDEKRSVYRTLLPDWLFDTYAIDRHTLCVNGEQTVYFRDQAGSRALEIVVKRYAQDIDPAFYVNMADTFNNQLLVLLVVINDPESERFNIDRDQHGNLTHLGTACRNIPAETAALNAGLAPGQVRRGQRTFRGLVPLFEDFIKKMGHDIFFIEPLAYHNAIVFERYGFSYVRGLGEMMRIHQGFQPGEPYYRALDGRSPFRQSTAWNQIRLRSWAIHDGILGHPFTGFQMYKRLGHHAGIETAPEIAW